MTFFSFLVYQVKYNRYYASIRNELGMWMDDFDPPFLLFQSRDHNRCLHRVFKPGYLLTRVLA